MCADRGHSIPVNAKHSLRAASDRLPMIPVTSQDEMKISCGYFVTLPLL